MNWKKLSLNQVTLTNSCLVPGSYENEFLLRQFPVTSTSFVWYIHLISKKFTAQCCQKIITVNKLKTFLFKYLLNYHSLKANFLNKQSKWILELWAWEERYSQTSDTQCTILEIRLYLWLVRNVSLLFYDIPNYLFILWNI